MPTPHSKGQMHQKKKRKKKKHNWKIAIKKTKAMVIAKKPIRYKLMMAEKTIEQVRRFIYFRLDITRNRNTVEQVQSQAMKLVVIPGQFRDVLWRHRYMNINSKTRINKPAFY